MNNNKINVGERVSVCGWMMPIVVERIEQESTGNTRIDLNWGAFGKSKVWLHDEGKTWFRFKDVN